MRLSKNFIKLLSVLLKLFSMRQFFKRISIKSKRIYQSGNRKK